MAKNAIFDAITLKVILSHSSFVLGFLSFSIVIVVIHYVCMLDMAIGASIMVVTMNESPITNTG